MQSMKRTRSSSSSSSSSSSHDRRIAAVEFASILNNNDADPTQIVDALKRFVHTVRADRRTSSAAPQHRPNGSSGSESSSSSSDGGSNNSGSSDSDSDDDGGEESKVEATPRSKKRFKKDELWKEDTANYNVPFVGTSIANSADPVQVGIWPTGLLQSYLLKSPLAIELTSDVLRLSMEKSLAVGKKTRQNTTATATSSSKEKQRQSRKLFQDFQKSLLLALTELLSAATTSAPSSSLELSSSKTTTTIPSPPPRFVAEIISQQIPHWLKVLVDEETSSHRKNKGRGGGSCGPVAAPILLLLEALSRVSVPTCRHVARILEQHVPDHIIRRFLLVTTGGPSRKQEQEQETTGEADENHMVVTTARDRARVATLQLAASLTECNDSVVFSCISTSGTKERKVPPGILFVALQKGLSPLPEQVAEQRRYRRVLQRLLRSVRSLLDRPMISRRSLSELFSRECLQHLGRLATKCGPPLAETHFEQVIASEDVYESNRVDKKAGVEARRLLFILVGDLDRSPLLQGCARQQTGARQHQLVVRPLLHLLGNDPSLEVRRFLLHVVSSVPVLLPEMFQLLSIPDARRPFALISRLHFISYLLRHGPAASACLELRGSSWEEDHEHILLSVLPQGLKKQNLGRAIQSPNHLIALEAFKLFSVVLERCHGLLLDLHQEHDAKYAAISEAFVRSLPDLQAVTAAISKLDTKNGTSKSHFVVFAFACKTVGVYTSLFSIHGEATKFDWTKLVPSGADVFCSAPFSLQYMVLDAMRDVTSRPDSVSSLSPSSCERLLKIARTTHSEAILIKVRALFIDLFCRAAGCKLGKVFAIEREYEASCWFDGVNSSTVEGVGEVIRDAANISPPTFITLALAWRHAGFKQPVPDARYVSPTFVCALRRLLKSSDAFSFLSLQVVAKCVLHSRNPIALAAVFLYFAKNIGFDNRADPLTEYCDSLVYFDRKDRLQRKSAAMSLFREFFGDNGIPNCGCNDVPGSALICSDSVSTVRQILHFAMMADLDIQREAQKMTRKLLPIIVLSLPEESRYFGKEVKDIIPWGDLLNWSLVDCLFLTSKVPVPADVMLRTTSTVAEVAAALDSRGGKLSKLLYLLIISESFPPIHLVSTVATLLNRRTPSCPGASSRAFFRLLSSLLRQSLECDDVKWMKNSEILSVTEFSLTTWMSLTDGNSDRTTHLPLIKQLEEVIVSNLSNGFASLALFQVDGEILVRRCFSCLMNYAASAEEQYGGDLLSKIVGVDPVRFAPLLCAVSSEAIETDNFRKLFYDGILDKVFARIFYLPAAAEKYEKELFRVGRLLNDRAKALLVENSNSQPLLDGFLYVLVEFCRGNFPLNSDVSAFLINVMSNNKITKTSGLVAQTASEKEKVIEISILLCRQNSSRKSCAAAPLFSALLSFLEELLPHSLKSLVKHQRMNDYVSPLPILTSLSELLSESEKFGFNEVLSKRPKTVSGILRTCLRYGIGTTSEGGNDVRLHCLKVVTALFRSLHTLTLRFDGALEAEIFGMAVLHSKFYAVLRSGNAEDYNVKLELLRIVLCCKQEANEKDCDDKLWYALLEVFDASVSPVDLVLRRLLECLSTKAPKEAQYVRLSHLRWGDTMDGESRPWEWLLDSIILSRVHETINNFPVYDASDNEQPTSLEGQIEDKRYSPAFLLPLILAALSDVFSKRNTSEFTTVDGSGDLLEGDAQECRLVIYTRRLCDRGGLALTLASLCSKCPRLRKISAAILFHLTSAVNSKESQQITSWRERPQIALLLNATQHALAIRHTEETSETRHESPTVPELPGFSAVFLAKASLILAHPSNPLFQAINRTFLRAETDAGAFQDLTRFPAFMSLFCSSSDEAEQLQRERSFALELVDAGFTDQGCFKQLLACHCIELLLSSIESASLCALPSSADETTSLLQTLKGLVIRGGQRQDIYLFKHCGIIAWLRSLLLGGSVSDQFPTRSNRIAILQLLTAAVRKAATYLPIEEFLAAMADIPTIAVSVAMVDSEILSKGKQVHKSISSPFSSAAHCCEYLGVLRREMSGKGNDRAPGVEETRIPCQSCSIDIELATSFLKCLDSKEQIREAALAFCILQLDCQPDASLQMRTFCETLLEKASSDSELLVPTLRRISALSRFCADCSFDEEGKIGRQILYCWTNCSRDNFAREAWFQCLFDISENDVDGELKETVRPEGPSDESMLVNRFLVNR